MLQQAPFGFDLIKKYVVLFGSTFDDIYVNRLISTTTSEIVKVPISYSNKDKMLAIVDTDPNKDRPYSVLLPRLGFSLMGMTYDSSRKTPTNNYIARVSNTNSSILYKQYVPIPYNFNFELYLLSKNTMDASHIIEQIIPFFTPDYTSRVMLIPEINLDLAIPIVLSGLSNEDLYDGDFKVRRTLLWTFRFILKGILCNPLKEQNPIKFIQTTFYDPDGNYPWSPAPNTWNIAAAVGNTAPLERMDLQVAMLANGQPTTNAAASVPYQTININDDYGYAETIYDFSGNVEITTF